MTLTPPALTAAQLLSLLAAARNQRLGNSALSILTYLHEHGASTLTSLARHSLISTAAVTGLADRLFALGFATRRPSLTDRRVIWLTLTPSGTAAVQNILTAAAL